MVNGERPACAAARSPSAVHAATGHIGMLDWKDWQRAIDSGYQHAIEVLNLLQ
jgi:NTE family protein